MTRVPRTKTRLKKRSAGVSEFRCAPGWRPAGGWLAALIAVMFLVHQTQVEGAKPLIRLVALTCSIGFGVLAWYLVRRGRRTGPLLRVGPDGVGIALGFDGWLDVPWSDVRAWRYWEPTGMALLVKRRQTRWVGVRLRDESVLEGRPWDQRLEMWFNRTAGRPSLAVLHPFVEGSILGVLEAFQTHAADLDDREGSIVRT